MSVILINPFEVEEEKEEDALSYWDSCAEYLRTQPGYIYTRLHRAISPNARFKFINVAEWESPEHFQAAVNSEGFQSVAAKGVDEYPHFPALYEVIRT